jgi:hypothetical protein
MDGLSQCDSGRIEEHVESSALSAYQVNPTSRETPKSPIAKWSELKKLRDIRNAMRIEAENEADAGKQRILDPMHIQDSSDQAEPAGARTLNGLCCTYADTSMTYTSGPPVYLACLDSRQELRQDGRQAAHDTADAFRSSDDFSEQLAKRRSSRESSDSSAARRVQFAAQLEQPPPAVLHSPLSSKGGGFAARMLRAVSGSFTRAFGRAPD